MAEYHLRDGNAWREYWSVPAESQVTLAEVRIAEPDPAGAQDNPAQPQPSQARTKQDEIPQHADMDKYGTQLNKQRSPGPANSHSVDTRNGHQADFYHDPDRNSFSDQNDSWLQVCNFTSLPGWTGGATGWTGTKNNCINQYQFNAAPGFDLGTPKVGPGGWSTHVGIHLNSVVNSPGISEMVSASQVKAGIGDNTGYYFYNFSYGGAVAGSDEGNHLTARVGW